MKKLVKGLHFFTFWVRDGRPSRTQNNSFYVIFFLIFMFCSDFQENIQDYDINEEYPYQSELNQVEEAMTEHESQPCKEKAMDKISSSITPLAIPTERYIVHVMFIFLYC